MTDYAALARLDGRGIVVLGVGSGIGSAVCQAVSGMGAEVLCVDLNAAVAEQAAGLCGGMAMQADVTSRDDMAGVFAHADALFGDRFAGVVNVVGVPLPGPLAAADDDRIARQFDLTLRPALLTVQLATPYLAARGGGSVVLIGSLAAEVSSLNIALYGVAKGAVNKLAAAAAHEFGPQGVRVNVISPGRIASSGVVPVAADVRARIEGAVPLRRMGQPSEIAGAVLFLLSDLAAYVTGVVIPVDGGIGRVSALPQSAPSGT